MIVIGIVSSLLVLFPITVHAQSVTEIPPPLFEPQPFDFGTNQELRELAPEPDFGWRLKIIGEDFLEFFTFNPLEKAQLKLQHAEERQKEIDDLDMRGLPIPFEYEERRIKKLNEAEKILTETSAIENTVLQRVIQSFETLRQMGELNNIRVLYSQLPTVVNANDEVKQAYNDKVNSLKTWQENCVGTFDVDSLLPLNTAIDKLEVQCPKLLELQKQFGRERIRLLITGQV